jgi:hypothetical protein
MQNLGGGFKTIRYAILTHACNLMTHDSQVLPYTWHHACFSAYHSFCVLQQCCGGSIYAPAPLSRLQFARRGALLARGCLLQPLRVGRVSVFGFALLVVAIAEAEGVMVIRLGMGGHRSQGLPFLAA